MPRIAVNGTNLYFEEHGTGKPLLLLHGFAGTTEMWKPQVEAFSAGHRFITYDLRGHGRSDAPASIKDYSIDIVAEDQRQLLKRLGIARCVVGGLSLGGFVTLGFWAKHPEMVAGMVLADTGPGYRNPRGGMELWNRARLEVAEVLTQQGIAGYLKSPYATTIYYSGPEIMRSHQPHGLANVSLGVMINPLMPPLEDIEAPTLVVCGDDDAAFLPPTEYMHKHIKGSEKVIIAKAGHAANMDQPKAFNDAVLRFLRGHDL